MKNTPCQTEPEGGGQGGFQQALLGLGLLSYPHLPFLSSWPWPVSECLATGKILAHLRYVDEAPVHLALGSASQQPTI